MTVNVMQVLIDCGINPWAVQLMCESFLKHPNPIEVEFPFPIHRRDTPGYVGVVIRLQPIPAPPAETDGPAP